MKAIGIKEFKAHQLTRVNLPKESWSWKVGGLGLPTGTAAALLDELRGERREIDGLELLTADQRLSEAAGAV